MILHVIGAWVANFLFILAVILLAKKCISGFYTQVIANLLYLYHAYRLNDWALFWLSFILVFINVYGIYKWRKKNVES